MNVSKGELQQAILKLQDSLKDVEEGARKAFLEELGLIAAKEMMVWFRGYNFKEMMEFLVEEQVSGDRFILSFKKEPIEPTYTLSEVLAALPDEASKEGVAQILRLNKQPKQ